jgi:hypothetical protein
MGVYIKSNANLWDRKVAWGSTLGAIQNGAFQVFQLKKALPILPTGIRRGSVSASSAVFWRGMG